MPLDAPPHDVEGLILRAIAEVCHVPPPRDVHEWAEAERIVSAESGSPWPGPWRTARMPYLREIMEAMTLSHPARRVTLKKGAQSGGSEAGLNLIGQVMAETPAPVLVMLPSIDMMRGYNRVKLDPMIQATPALSRRVEDVVARSGEESTTTFKRFAGGYLQLLTAASSANLQMRSARVLLMEEVSDYPLDADGRGDPVKQMEARAIIYSGREKIVKISTPGEEGTCRISADYEKSSRGRLFVPCPHCGEKQTLEWENLKWPSGRPQEARYHCAGCGAGIEEVHKPAMLAQHEWRHEVPELLEVHAGFAWNGLYSTQMKWADLAAEWVEIQGDQEQLKTFVQQKLGRAWRVAGEAPEWQRLYDRREAWKRGHVPRGALLLTAGVDVQRDRLELSLWGWGRNRESWLVDHIVIPGSPFLWRTWEQVAAVLDAVLPHEAGGGVPISMAAVDSGDGVSTAEVYAFVRKVGQRRAIAIKGRDGLPQAIAPGGKVDVLRNGKRVGGMKPWLVGSSYLKGEFYGQLRLDKPTEESGAAYPRGYVHLPRHVVGEELCKQLVAEELRRTKQRNGQVRMEWVKTQQRNEALDCRVYARAAAVFLGVDRWPDSRWDELEAAVASRVPALPEFQMGLALPEGDDGGEEEAGGAPEGGPEAEDDEVRAEAPAEMPAPPPSVVARPRPPVRRGGYFGGWR